MGRAIAKSGLRREELFVTTKLLPMRGGAIAELHLSLQRLGLDYVDLYLIHWPVGPQTVRHWENLLRARQDGLAREVGVSNHGVAELTELIAISGATPAVNQVHSRRFASARSCAGAVRTTASCSRRTAR